MNLEHQKLLQVQYEENLKAAIICMYRHDYYLPDITNMSRSPCTRDLWP